LQVAIAVPVAMAIIKQASCQVANEKAKTLASAFSRHISHISPRQAFPIYQQGEGKL